MTYQLQARTPSSGWFAVTVTSADWSFLLYVVSLWRKANPDCELRAVKWSDRLR